MSPRKSQRIILTGFMGTGKSRVGKLVADELAWPFVDLDIEIERDAGRSITDIFTDEGEDAFRRREKSLLLQVLGRDPAVIATGGGAIINPENRRAMKQAGWLVCLSATPEQIYRRLQDSDDRPLLQVAEPLVEIRRLLDERRPFYEEADDVIETDQKNAAEIAQEVVSLYRTRYPSQAEAESL